VGTQNFARPCESAAVTTEFCGASNLHYFDRGHWKQQRKASAVQLHPEL
jgi:hypothetical protein